MPTAPMVVAETQKDSCSLYVLINHNEVLQQSLLQCKMPASANRAQTESGNSSNIQKWIIKQLDLRLNSRDADPEDQY